MQSPDQSVNVRAPVAEATPGRRPAVDPASPLPRCCEGWIAETAHAWHRQQGRRPLSSGPAPLRRRDPARS